MPSSDLFSPFAIYLPNQTRSIVTFITPGGRRVNYNIFTAKPARSGFEDGYLIFGFFCLRETLEKTQKSRESEF
jgi:hypothetical protein